MPLMSGALLGVLALALLDSINPSALAVTIYLLITSRPYTARVLTYIAAIFCTYLTIGVAMMLGLDAVLGWAGDLLESPVVYGAQGIIGGAMLIYAIAAPDPKIEDVPQTRVATRSGLIGIALLGVTITAVELVTAFPYFGAIGILTREGLSLPEWLPVLIMYNVIFVLPPLALLTIYRLFGQRLEERFRRLIPRLNKEARVTMLWIIGIVGFFLLADSISQFESLGISVDFFGNSETSE